MKQQKIEIPSKVKAEGKSAERNLPAEILNILDQGIMMWSAEGTFMLFNTRGALDGMCNWNTVDLHDSISADSCWALRRGRSYEYEEGGLCVECEHVATHRHEVSVPEYICIPIIAHGDTVGLLHIRFDRIAAESAHMTKSAKFAVRCGEHISMAIANVKLRDELHEKSVRDPLTGLFNRRYLVEALRREINADRKSTRLNSSHVRTSRMPSSA